MTNLSDYMPQKDVQNGNIAAKLRSHCRHRLAFRMDEDGFFVIQHFADDMNVEMVINADDVMARSWEETARNWLDYLHEAV